MARLRDRSNGCPWDLEQTFATIAPYTIEEAYEVADAIERGALDDLEGELGDLLFQVVFHARMAEETGAFDFGDVVAGISDKLVRRHPHVFGSRDPAPTAGPGPPAGAAPAADAGPAAGVTRTAGAALAADPARATRPPTGAAEQSRVWEAIKRGERSAAGSTGVLADVPVGLPGLSRAAKLGKRAATVGFDWPDLAGVRDKLREEIAELDAELNAAGGAAPGAANGTELDATSGTALKTHDTVGNSALSASAASGSSEAIAAEIGDLLFTIANLCRHLDVDPEACVRGANARFEKRFGYVESRVRERSDWSAFDASELDRLWRDAKSGSR